MDAARDEPSHVGEHTAAERVARTSYGQLVAYLARWSGDLADAEDALADAFVAALRHWPQSGVPANPVGWLLKAARRRLLDFARRERVRSRAAEQIEWLAGRLNDEAGGGGDDDDPHIPDERLALMLACAHPEIEAAARTPLMLQAVLGLDAKTIAQAFVVAPSAMAQRLVRAKRKLGAQGLRLAVPNRDEWPARLSAVLAAIYGAYGTGWDALGLEGDGRSGLAGEAVLLGRLVVELLPDDPEARGLLALMLHCEARREARRDADGRYVPLSDQDSRLWSDDLLREAEDHLWRASRAGVIGRYQLEAAIQSAHAARRFRGGVDWDAVVELYRGLVRVEPSLGARVGLAAAVAEVSGAKAALDVLDAIPNEQVPLYLPYWALRSRLLAQVGALADARSAARMAIGLSTDPAIRAFHLEYLDRLQ